MPTFEKKITEKRKRFVRLLERAMGEGDPAKKTALLAAAKALDDKIDKRLKSFVHTIKARLP